MGYGTGCGKPHTIVLGIRNALPMFGGMLSRAHTRVTFSHHLRVAVLADLDSVSAVRCLDVLFPCVEKFRKNPHRDVSLNVATKRCADR